MSKHKILAKVVIVVSFQKEKRTTWPDLFSKRNNNKNFIRHLVMGYWFLVTSRSNGKDIFNGLSWCKSSFETNLSTYNLNVCLPPPFDLLKSNLQLGVGFSPSQVLFCQWNHKHFPLARGFFFSDLLLV